ncbi:MAG: site-specific integrase [Lachnospiraceae bacterium]|nr:site-specific integrase [Lachnospiraceae bacterium]
MKQNESIREELTVRSAGEQWLNIKKSSVKDSTYDKYCNSFHTMILPYVGDVRINGLTTGLMEEFIEKLFKKGYAAKSISDTMSILKGILAYACLHGASCPANLKVIRVRREQAQAEIRVFSEEEQAALMEYLSSNQSPRNMGIQIALYTGLRVGELCALTWDDIDLDQKVIHVRRTMQRIRNRQSSGARTLIVCTSPKSRTSKREIPISDKILPQLYFLWNLAWIRNPYAGHDIPLYEDGLSPDEEERQGQKSGRPSGDKALWKRLEKRYRMHREELTERGLEELRRSYVLTGTGSECIEPRNMQYQIAKVLKHCGLEPAGFHATRHSFATRCAERGCETKALSEILGHSSVTITLNRYVHPSMEAKKSVIDKL